VIQPLRPWPKPTSKKSSFILLLESAEGALAAYNKRQSLFASDGEWPGAEAWLEKWRGTPWPERKK
jgi:hypothetical protein